MSNTTGESNNQIIRALRDTDRDWLLSRSTLEDAPVKRTFVTPDRPTENVYFVEGGLVSMVVTMSDGSSVEVGTIGSEGVVGLDAFLGGQPGRVEVFQQVEGHVTVVPVRDFQELLKRSSELNEAMRSFTTSLLRQMTTAVACNRLHPVDRRLARWLLMVRDRVQSNDFSLTQIFLAEMLGVRRPGVSIAAAMLKRARLIRYSRGKIQILDPAGLEAVACDCYRALRASASYTQ